MAAGEIDEAHNFVAVEEGRRLFPNDPAIEWFSVNYFLVKKEYDKALRCIEAVENAVGGDPYLQAKRAQVFVDAGRLQQAKAAAEKAVELEPGLADAYWSRVDVAVKEKNHKDTLDWLKRVVEETDDEVEDLTTAPEYGEFIKSPQHKEWLKWYADRKK